MGNLCGAPKNETASESVAGTTTSNSTPIRTEAESAEPKQPMEVSLKPTIKVFACRGLRNADWGWFPGSTNVSDAYVICKEKKKALGPGGAEEKTLLTTKTIPNCLEPIFDQEFEVDFARNSILEFAVWDRDPIKPDDFLGCAHLQCDQLARGFNGELELAGAGEKVKAYIKVMVKMPGSDYPLGPATQFEISLEKDKKDKTKLGFEFDKTASDILFVTCVCDHGPVKAYNDTVAADKQMKTGQYIVAVNGIKDVAQKMADELAKADKLELLMVRPHCFTIAIAKKGALGLKLAQAAASNVITDIEQGPVNEWNKAYPDKVVKVGDRIVAVNENRAKGADQMQLLKKDGPMQIVISRRCPPAGLAGAIKGFHWFWDWF